MLGVNQSDFMSYMSALKSNYRKGVHRMEAILANPTHAKEFAANLGGVSVVLGVPVNLPDRNSDKLLELLLGSTVADDAVLTWMHQFYEFSGKIAGSISHVGACLGIRWLCNRVPWVLHKLCGEQRLVNFLLHFFAGNALVDLFFCASAEFSILTVDKDGQKRVRYFFRAAHVELLTDEKCLAGFGLLFADQKVAGFACF